MNNFAYKKYKRIYIENIADFYHLRIEYIDDANIIIVSKKTEMVTISIRFVHVGNGCYEPTTLDITSRSIFDKNIKDLKEDYKTLFRSASSAFLEFESFIHQLEETTTGACL